MLASMLVLVTGAAGRTGRAAIRALAARGIDVRAWRASDARPPLSTVAPGAYVTTAPNWRHNGVTMARTSVRLSDFVYRRLEAVADASGLSINGILTVACIEWMDQHFPLPPASAVGPVESRPADGQLGPFERFTSTARKVLARTPQVAAGTGAPQIGISHLALALLDVQEGLAACILKRLDVERTALAAALGLVEDRAGDAVGEPEGLKPSDSLKQVLEIAFASSAKHAPVIGRSELLGSDHLLLGVLMADDDAAARALERLGVTEEAVRKESQLCRQAGVAEIA
jgi:hypothetical protein